MRVVLVLLIVLIPATTSAQDVVPRRLQALQEVPEAPVIPPGSDEIQPLARGDRAPFSGMLLSTDTAIRWTNALRWWPEVFRLRVSEFGDVVEAVEASQQHRLRIVESSYQREIQGLRTDLRQTTERLARAHSRPWYDTVAFGLVVGVVVAVLLGGVAAGLAIAAAS
jgi:hypothetical protein